MEILLRRSKGSGLEVISHSNPFPIEVVGSAPTQVRTVHCPPDPVQVPGIASGDALDALDAVGYPFTIRVPKSGVIYGARWYDLSDQGSSVRVHLFRKPFAMAASDAAWSPSDDDVLNLIGILNFECFEDHINSQVSYLEGLAMGYSTSSGIMYVGVSLPVGSTPTYTAPGMPRLQLTVFSDDPLYEEY